MNIFSTGEVVPQLARDVTANRGAILHEVDLPDTFEPPVTDVVFLKVEDAIEVYIGAETRYNGASPTWHAIQARPVLPGPARFVTRSEEPDVATAFRSFTQLLLEAGGTIRPQDYHGVNQPRVTEEIVRGQPSEEHPRFLRNMVAVAAQQPRHLAGREPELERLITCLLRETKPGVVLVGPAGCGKTTLVEMLAERIATGHVPEPLQESAMFDLSLGRVLENGRMVGEIERHVETVLNTGNQPIIFVDELHQIARPELQPVADLLKPALASGQIRLIGATTPTEFRSIQDHAFRRRLTEIRVGEPTLAETFEMVGVRIGSLERHHQIQVDERQLREAIVLSHRFVPDRTLPDKAIDLLDHAAAMQRTASTGFNAPLERQYLLASSSAQARLPASYLDSHQSAVLVEDAALALRAHLTGQDTAIHEIEQVLNSRLAERDLVWQSAIDTLSAKADGRPLACLLLTGPTGVGKTESARLLAERLFNGQIITLNAADVGPEAPHGVATWVGSPPGYVGYNRGGVLTDGLRAHRACVLLIDEIEKAAPEAVQNILLPLLGDGTVTDRNTGEALSTAECLVIGTSNIQPATGQQGGIDAPSTSTRTDVSELHQALVRHLRPEVLGRFHAVLAYAPFDHAALWEIWHREMDKLTQLRGLAQPLVLDTAAEQWVDERLARIRTGARGVLDLFRNAVLPIVAVQSGSDSTHLTSDGARLVNASALTSNAADENSVADSSAGTTTVA